MFLILKTKKGRRKKKWLREVMDASNGYGEDMYGFGDFDEALGQVRCSNATKPVIPLPHITSVRSQRN